MLRPCCLWQVVTKVVGTPYRNATANLLTRNLSSIIATKDGLGLTAKDGRVPAVRCLATPARAAKSEETGPYHAGLRNTSFTSECNISSESQVIPIFRVLGYDGKLLGGWRAPFTAEECVERYKFIVRLSVYDMMLYNIQRQGRISFYMQNQGEEVLQTAIGNALGKDDHLWCQYRELGVLMWRGFTVRDALGQLFRYYKWAQRVSSYLSLSQHLPGSKQGASNAYLVHEKRDWPPDHMHPLTTQVPHASGCGYAFKLSKEKRAAVAFFGEGAASEGDFHAALNFAAVLKSQTIFICRNNGYAISTPVKEQYAGDGIAIRGLAYGMDTIRVDGNDFFASYIATKKAWERCVNESKPVCIEFMTYRVGHHSTSDDSSQYRPPQEMKIWMEPGVNAIQRFRLFLESNGLWDDTKEDALRKEAKKTMLEEIKQIEAEKACPIVPGMFDDVYDVEPWHLKEQRASFKEHLQKHAHHYDMTKYPKE